MKGRAPAEVNDCHFSSYLRIPVYIYLCPLHNDGGGGSSSYRVLSKEKVREPSPRVEYHVIQLRDGWPDDGISSGLQKASPFT